PALPVAAGQDALLGWAVREATTNVLRHAQCSRCRIELHRDDDRILLRIGDDGTHVRTDDATTEPQGNDGTGLTGLRERFGAAGGDLEARPGERGFTVTATLPATTGVPS
ncbi:MAG TPA: ATP-binding protein, partial [Nocardioidaceae bacterium]|nr:ATP-binding protein [Nocardioidaceae bacterium]